MPEFNLSFYSLSKNKLHIQFIDLRFFDKSRLKVEISTFFKNLTEMSIPLHQTYVIGGHFLSHKRPYNINPLMSDICLEVIS